MPVDTKEVLGKRRALVVRGENVLSGLPLISCKRKGHEGFECFAGLDKQQQNGSNAFRFEGSK